MTLSPAHLSKMLMSTRKDLAAGIVPLAKFMIDCTKTVKRYPGESKY
jgi:hypothetical protein